MGAGWLGRRGRGAHLGVGATRAAGVCEDMRTLREGNIRIRSRVMVIVEMETAIFELARESCRRAWQRSIEKHGEVWRGSVADKHGGEFLGVCGVHRELNSSCQRSSVNRYPKGCARECMKCDLHLTSSRLKLICGEILVWLDVMLGAGVIHRARGSLIDKHPCCIP